ncbi:hypothetical protein [Streptomyces kanamyceticus]|uniref:Secreted protein n=1 Tax=Streptomyces kanamyceticus TaxID=1967 RepID=A0A5J6GGB1_STRKN|nr:hypothetical protein [Streptomyces kanamyceticus]QEU92935.1 hypothetical protein CP970_20285 [Streptomyces kanamyceticus]
MRRLLNAALLTALVGSTTAVMAPAALASPGPAANTVPGCVTKSDTIEGATGEIKVCVENGVARVSGTLTDTLPGPGFGEPDGACAVWWIKWDTTEGPKNDSVLACGHFSDPVLNFDFDPAAGSGGVKGITGVKEVSLDIGFM